MAQPNMIAIVWIVYALLLTYLERMVDAKQLIQNEIDAISEPELNIFLMRFLMIITNDLILNKMLIMPHSFLLFELL